MRDDFIDRPDLGAKVLLGERLDAFQTARLKLTMWTPRVMDSSGFSSTKTRGAWIASNLRCLLIPDHVCAVYYQRFDSGKTTYWPYFNEVAGRSEIFRAHLGRTEVVNVDDEDKKKKIRRHEERKPSYWQASYKNGSKIIMPAPDFAKDSRSQAGLRFNDLFIDEWTKIEATGTKGIDDQLLGRTSRACFNQHHPFWANKHVFLATPEDWTHQAFRRYEEFMQAIRSGDTDYVHITFCYKDYSDQPFDGQHSFRELFREERLLRDMKTRKTRIGFMQEGLGIWTKTGHTLYDTSMLKQSRIIGQQMGNIIITNHRQDPEKDPTKRFYFLGADIAKGEKKKSDDGALVTIRASPLTEQLSKSIFDWAVSVCYAYKVRGFDADEWAALIHMKNLAFGGFSRICMDHGGGGQWVEPELAKEKVEWAGRTYAVKPIATIEKEESMMVYGDFNLMMFTRGDHRVKKLWENQVMRGDDNLIDAAHTEVLQIMSKGLIGIPDLKPAESDGFDQEGKWAAKLVSLVSDQFSRLSVKMNDDGTVFRTKNGAREFQSRGRKDFAYATIHAMTAFLSWLNDIDDMVQVNDEDAAMCG